MFIPDYIESAFDHASLNGSPIVKKKVITYESVPEALSKQWFTPLAVFSCVLLLAIGLTVLDWKRKKSSTWFDVILFSITGLIGFLLIFLWFFTDHQAASPNLNLLWALPTNFIAALLLLKKKIPLWLGRYFMVVTIIANLTLFSWVFLPQQLNFYLVPLVIAVVVRSIWNYLFAFETLFISE